MRHASVSLLGVALLLPVSVSLALPAAGLSLVPVEQERSVRAAASVPDDPTGSLDVESAMDFLPFDATAMASSGVSDTTASATASQVSSIEALSVMASGSASAESFGGGAGADGSSRFLFVFDLTSTALYSLDVYLFAIGDQPGNPTHSAFHLRDPDSGEIFHRLFVDDDLSVESLFVEGVLAPGRYELWAYTDSESLFGERPSSSYYLHFTVVPEPSTCLLVATGLLGLAMSRRSTRTSRI